MPTDLDINREKDIHLDSANDLELTSGQPWLDQSVALVTMDVTSERIGESITGADIGILEEKIAERLEEDATIGDILYINIETYNRDTGTVSLQIGLTSGVELERDVQTNAS